MTAIVLCILKCIYSSVTLKNKATANVSPLKIGVCRALILHYRNINKLNTILLSPLK